MNTPKVFQAPTVEDVESQIRQVTPEEHAGYFKQTEEKHFDPEKAVGSLFTKEKNFNDLLKKAIEQRGNLDGDDRDQFIAMGVKPDALLPFCRYLKVDTEGEVGIKDIKELPSETKVKVIRTKEGAPCSLVIESDEFPEVGFGTIVIGPNEKAKDAKPEDPEPSTKEMVWTVHPGLPVRPAMEDSWPEGSEITVSDVIEKLGRDVYLNVKKTSNVETQSNQPMRPAPEKVQERIEDLKEQRKVNRNFQEVIWEIEDMAEGGGADGIRKKFYPGWANEDFQTVLDALESN